MKHVARWALLLTVALVARARAIDAAQHLSASDTVASDAARLAVNAVQVLLAGPAALAFGLFSRIAGPQTLEHPTRARIRDLVEARPGVSLQETARILGIGWGTTVHHVNRLESSRLLVSVAAGRRRALYLPQAAPRPAPQGVPCSDVQLRMLQEIRERPGAAQHDVADAAGVSLPLAHRYLSRLERHGLVASTKEWRTRRYAPTPALGAFLSAHPEAKKAQSPNRPFGGLPTTSPGGTSAG